MLSHSTVLVNLRLRLIGRQNASEVFGFYEEGIREYEKAEVLGGSSPEDAAARATVLRRALKKGGEAGVWQKAYAEHDGEEITLLKVDPSFKNLRGDPRFGNLLRRVGLPE